jgi:hypothetical protein
VLFGNHDHYPMLHNQHSLGDWSLDDDVLYVRGARSVDRAVRTEGVDWWANEELEYKQFQVLIDFAHSRKPRMIVSHDCPQSVTETVFGHSGKSITGQGLQRLLEVCAPALWVFGHHHRSVDVTIGGTRFKCLNELECFQLPCA